MYSTFRTPTIVGISGTVIALLICVIGGSFLHDPKISRCYKTKYDLRNIVIALESFNDKNNRYPSLSEGLNILAQPSDGGKPFIKRIKNDSWGTGFYYSIPAKLNYIHEFDLYSFGENTVNDTGSKDDYPAWSDINCYRNKKSCLTISVVYIGLPLFLLSFVVGLRHQKHNKSIKQTD